MIEARYALTRSSFNYRQLFNQQYFINYFIEHSERGTFNDEE